MTAGTDVVVIGAGILGAATARELAAQGLSVTIFDNYFSKNLEGA